MSNLNDGIEPELAPMSASLIQSWNQRSDNAQNASGEQDLTGTVNALIDQNKALLLALARIERAVNREAGKVVTDK